MLQVRSIFISVGGVAGIGGAGCSPEYQLNRVSALCAPNNFISTTKEMQSVFLSVCVSLKLKGCL